MDPVTLLLAALAAGASTGASDAAKDAVVGLYGQLKAALTDRFGGDPGAKKTLERHAGNPAGYEAPLRDLIVESGARDDATIVNLARELLATTDPAGAQVGKYNVQIAGGQGTVIGDGAHV